MSVMDGSRLLDDAGLSGAALQRNAQLIGYVRLVLARQDVEAFARLMHDFSELIDDCGPLAFLRFDPTRFDIEVRRHLPQAPHDDAEALCDRLHESCIDSLATDAFLRTLRAELQQFLQLPYPPSDDRLAACAALLTTTGDPRAHGLSRKELPAIYAIFRVQLIGWLLQAGAKQAALAEVAAALT